MTHPGTYKDLPAPFRPTPNYLDLLALTVCDTHGKLGPPYRKLHKAHETFGVCPACGTTNTIFKVAKGSTLPKKFHFLVCETCHAIQPLQNWPEATNPTGVLKKCPPPAR